MSKTVINNYASGGGGGGDFGGLIVAGAVIAGICIAANLLLAVLATLVWGLVALAGTVFVGALTYKCAPRVIEHVIFMRELRASQEASVVRPQVVPSPTPRPAGVPRPASREAIDRARQAGAYTNTVNHLDAQRWDR